VVDVVSEKKARDILNGDADAKTMDKAELRKRLATMRELLAANKLSPETNKALRQKLATERTYLRQEVVKDNAGGGQGGNTTVTNININNDITIKPDVVKVVIADKRPSADLRDDELRVRINVYRKLVIDVKFTESERQQWRAAMERDRVILRQRLLAARAKRQADLRAKAKDIDLDLSVEFKPSNPLPPRSVFAAEAEDKEIADVLAAPPRRKLARKYSVEEVETDPGLRDAVARIEIDTVHFGFGEGFLREEEIDNLDRIAEVMEQILAVNPGEVFMIEGHTDAVGSDQSNLDLSRERARAVKQALTTYFVIPGENLKTVGFGERYLKIPTPDPEAENRRVSVARITALVGALEQ
jgi:outer membrane protein OmpA-like peptidoglycan-associated protein